MKADVTIVGAGLSGLVAANLLVKHGLTVQVLDARRRLGGRLARQTPSDRRYVGVFHSHVHAWCREFCIELARADMSEGHRLLPDRVKLDGAYLSKARLARLSEELNGVIERLVSLAEDVDLTHPWRSRPGVRRLDEIAVEDWLADQHSSLDLRAVFTDLPPRSQSVLGLLCLIGAAGRQFFTDSEAYVMESPHQLCEALARTAGISLRLGEALVDVVDLPSGVQLLSQVRGGRTQRTTSAAAIIALPPPCRKAIDAVNRLDTAPTTVMVRNRTLSLIATVAANEAANLPDWVITDGPCRLASYERLTEGSVRCDVLVCPHLATRSCSSREVAATALEEAGVAAAEVSACASVVWSRSRWSGGSYPAFPPGALGAPPEGVRSRLAGKVLLAGDSLSPDFAGYMEGAIRSGEAAAMQLLESMA